MTESIEFKLSEIKFSLVENNIWELYLPWSEVLRKVKEISPNGIPFETIINIQGLKSTRSFYCWISTLPDEGMYNFCLSAKRKINHMCHGYLKNYDKVDEEYSYCIILTNE